ncbi:hypothetical protein BN159_0706 [Streptomyces davaonensis JCM 4913]|uniref:Caspase domain-containing protein n=2 Tax=Streptomyces davaonensis TaxID=348043 RepID=K4QW75_STRDJ|nr:hypothetical protein BN159_0706 [Streptomyces davaonensis JCM 4913]
MLSDELRTFVEPFDGGPLRVWLIQVVKQCAEVGEGLACMARSLEYVEQQSVAVGELWLLVDEWEACDLFGDVEIAPLRPVLASLVSDLLPMAQRASTQRRQELPPWCVTGWHVFLSLAGDSAPTYEHPPSLVFLDLVAERLVEEGRVKDAAAVNRWQREARVSLGLEVAEARKAGYFEVAVTPPPEPSGEAPARPTPSACWTVGGAVLVGIGAYAYLPDVPAIHNNLADMQRLLISDEFGIPVENCRVLMDPKDPRQIHAAIEDVMEQVDPASGAFLFYYAGHGRAHPSHGRLLLSMADSREHQTYSYWSFDSLRDQIADCGLSTRLVILDSCYSGSALDLLSGPVDASSAAIRGTYVMASSGATEPSTAPDGARYTDFTGQILAALRSGIPGAGPVVDADALFETVRAQCLANGLPVPARQIRNEGSRIPLMRNRAYQVVTSSPTITSTQ